MTVTITRRHLILLAIFAASVFLVSSLLNYFQQRRQLSDWSLLTSGPVYDQVWTPDGAVQARIVRVLLTDGRTGHLIIPNDAGREQLYYRDEAGVYPVSLSDPRPATREQVTYYQATSQPAVTERYQTVSQPIVTERTVIREVPASPAPQPVRSEKKRSWEREVLIVAGSSGAGAAIGAAAGGKKGAAVGAISGGVAGLVYDLATR